MLAPTIPPPMMTTSAEETNSTVYRTLPLYNSVTFLACTKVNSMPKALWIRIGLVGLSCFALAMLWMTIAVDLQKRHDPPGWIVDRAAPQGPQLLAWIGMALVLAAMLLGIAMLIRRLIRR